MRHVEFPGGWYVDALPDGTYVAVWNDGRIEANSIALPPPPNGAVLPLFPRLRAGAWLEFSGQEWQAHDRVLTWRDGWTVDDRVACGVSPCIYDNTGLLHVNVDCAVGSQGWRYVTPENVLITGDATYGPTVAWRLWEWTQLDADLVIGQGENGGCLVWDRGQLRALIPESAGVCRFIRAVRDGADVSVAYWGQSGVPSAAHWLTVADLRALPLAVPAAPPVPPVEPPPIVLPPAVPPVPPVPTPPPPVVIPPVPPPIPPLPPGVPMHPILDAPLTPAYPVGYLFWITHWSELADEAEAWYQRAFDRPPAPPDVAHGLWRALNEGERWQTARRAFEESWPGGAPDPAPTPPGPIPPGPVPPGVAPVLSIRGRQFFNGDTLYIPRWVSGLTLLTKSPVFRDAYLNWVLQTGFNGIRVFAGALPWASQTPAGALQALPGLLDACAVRGLATEVTALTETGTGYNCETHLDTIGALVAGRKSVVCEVWNEYLHHTQRQDISVDTSIDWGRRYFGARGILWAVGAANVDEPSPDGIYPTSGGDYATAHLNRDRETWNNVRRVREIYAIAEDTGQPALNNEPMGADEVDGSVSGKQRWNDPALFFTLGALDRAFGVGGVHHSQAGLMAELPGPVQQACADAYVAAHTAIDAILPSQVGSYRNVGHEGSPLLRATFVEGGAEAGVVRAYSFIAGDRGVTVLVGLKVSAGLEWGNGWHPVGSVPLASRTAHDGRSVAVLEIAR